MQNTPGLPQCGIRDFAKADILSIVISSFVGKIYVEADLTLLCS